MNLRSRMNPDKLFDYLDGKLSPADREQLEEKLMSDAQLRRQFNVARDIHRNGGGSREVIVPGDDPATAERGGRLGRRIATAAVVLVFLNVIAGLAVITVKNRKPPAEKNREREIREQLSASLGAAAQKAMPPPTFTAGEIQLTIPRAEWENVASRIMTAAQNFAGSATKGLPDENLITVVVDVPSSREAEFRQALTSAAGISPMPAMAAGTGGNAAPSNERSIIQVRISEAAR